MNENLRDIYPFRRNELLSVGLKYNPFNPGGESNLHKYFVDRDDAVSRIINQFEEIVNEKRMKTFFIMGEEGLGRTSILKVLEYEFGKGFSKDLVSRIKEIDKQVNLLKERYEKIKSIKDYRDGLEESLKELKNFRENHKNATEILSGEIPNSLKAKIEDYFEAKKLKEKNKSKETRKLLKDIGDDIRNSVLKKLLKRRRIPSEQVEQLLTSIDLKCSWKEIRDFCQKELDEIEKIVIERERKRYDRLYNEMAKHGLEMTSTSHEELIEGYDKQLSSVETELANTEATYRYIEQEYKYRSEKFESLIIADKERLIKGQVLRDKILFIRTLIDITAQKVNLTNERNDEEFFHKMIENIKRNSTNKDLTRSFQNELQNKGYTAESYVRLYAFNGTVRNLLEILVETSEKCRPKLNEEEALLTFLKSFFATLEDFFTALIFLFDDATHFGGKRVRDVRNIIVNLFQSKPSIFVFVVDWTYRLPATYGELYSRFGEYTDLTKSSFLTKDDCEKSIMLRLESARVEGWNTRDSFEPFSEAAVIEIAKESRKVPIFWVYMCYHCLELLRMQIQNGSRRVTAEMANEAIQNAWGDIIDRLSENQRTMLFVLAERKHLGAQRLAKMIGKDLGNTSKNLAKLRRVQLLTFRNIPRSKSKIKSESQLSTFKAYSIAIPSLEKYLKAHLDECPLEVSG